MTPALRQRSERAAAELVLDLGSPAALRALIDEAVDVGFMSPHCLDALAQGAELEAMLPAFDDLLAALGLPMPGRTQAAMFLIHDRLDAIASGRCDALDALAEVVRIQAWALSELAPARYGAGLHELVGLESCIGDLQAMQLPCFGGQTGEAAWQALRAAIRHAAAAWLQR